MKGKISVLGQTIHLKNHKPVLVAPLLKGTTLTDLGAFYAPYIPVGIRPMTWQEHLDYYSLRLFDNTTLPQMKLNPEKTILDIAQEFFQKKWPGNYIIQEFYNPKRGRIDLRLKFVDPKEETLWLLRWS